MGGVYPHCGSKRLGVEPYSSILLTSSELIGVNLFGLHTATLRNTIW